MTIKQWLLTDEKIGKLLTQANKDYWTHKPHPIFEVEKYVLQAQLRQVVEELGDGNRDGEYVYLYLLKEDWQSLRREAGLDE